jgi:hypothetical protein
MIEENVRAAEKSPAPEKLEGDRPANDR